MKPGGKIHHPEQECRYLIITERIAFVHNVLDTLQKLTMPASRRSLTPCTFPQYGCGMECLDNYLRLLSRVDELCSIIAERFAASIVCRKGCDGCCRHLTVFPVEAAALRRAMHDLAPEERAIVTARAREATPEGHCPLLSDGACLLYKARPVICRTQGMPLLIHDSESRRIDFCPLNFRGIDSLPGNAVIDLETLNTLLAGVNQLFTGDGAATRRSIGQALLEDEPGNRDHAGEGGLPPQL